MAHTLLHFFLGFAAILLISSSARAETHTIRFDNKCGHGTPTLIVGGHIVSTGQDYTNPSGPIVGGIAYLQTGYCNFNGENCTLLEMTIGNSHCIGCGSSTDISLIPPHAFNVETSFSYYNGCDGLGAVCSTPNCPTAFFNPNDNQVQVACQEDNVDLLITFCGDATQAASVTPHNATTPAHTSSAAHKKPTPAHPPKAAASPPAEAEASTPSSAPAHLPANRASCNNKRRAEAQLLAKSEQESREIYDSHRRHVGHSRDFSVAGAHRRFV